MVTESSVVGRPYSGFIALHELLIETSTPEFAFTQSSENYQILNYMYMNYN